MPTAPTDFQLYLDAPEGARFEFKEAKGSYHFEELVKYCVALANEGGGKIMLGVTDRRPRQIVGTAAFAEPGRTEAGLYQALGCRIPVEEVHHEGKRILILNAACHRDYRAAGSIFVRQFARRLEVISPGGLPAGVTPENILDQQRPRNRRLAEAFGRCGLVERAGQGMNLMFERAVLHSKPLPDFTGTAAHEVRLTLHGTVQNPAFVRFLEKVGQERLASFSTHDFLILDLIQREHPVPNALKPRLAHLKEHGIVESVGRGRGTRYFLSRRFHVETGQAGAYTRKRGLGREANKAILLKHVADTGSLGAKFDELLHVLPGLSRDQVRWLLRELHAENRLLLRGQRKAARWFARSSPMPINPTT